MSIYLLLISFVLIVSFLSEDKRIPKNYQAYWFGVFFIVLSLFAGTRLMGYDFGTYQNHFNIVPDILHFHRADSTIELGYELLVSLYKTFSDSFNGFLTFYTGITLLFAGIVCFRYSPNPLISLAMFFAYAFFTQVMGQMRQPFSILFLYLFLIPLIIKHKYKTSIIIILLTTVLLHKSSILALGILVFKDRILKPKLLGMITLCVILIYLGSSHLMKLLLQLVPKSFFLYNALEAYTTYKAIQVGFTLGMIERIGMFLVAYYYANRYNLYQTNQRLRLFINLYFTGVCIYFSFISVAAEFATRGAFFYVYSLFFIMPTLIKEVQIKDKYFLYTIILLWSVYLAIGVFGIEEYLPYKSSLTQ